MRRHFHFHSWRFKGSSNNSNNDDKEDTFIIIGKILLVIFCVIYAILNIMASS